MISKWLKYYFFSISDIQLGVRNQRKRESLECERIHFWALVQLKKKVKIKEKDVEERARKDRRNNMVIFGIKVMWSNEWQRKTRGRSKVIWMGKYTEGKKRLIIIMIGTEEKKKEIFKNLHKLRRLADNITITHDLTVQQREELHELIKEAKIRKNVINQKGLSTEFRVHHGDGMWRKLRNSLRKEKHQERNRRVKMKNKLKNEENQLELKEDKEKRRRWIKKI